MILHKITIRNKLERRYGRSIGTHFDLTYFLIGICSAGHGGQLLH